MVGIEKLREYCLNPFHPRGRHKARVFASALKLYRSDAGVLRLHLLQAALSEDAVQREADEYGRRFTIDFELVNGDARALVRSVWIILTHEDFPQLVTCFVLSSQD